MAARARGLVLAGISGLPGTGCRFDDFKSCRLAPSTPGAALGLGGGERACGRARIRRGREGRRGRPAGVPAEYCKDAAAARRRADGGTRSAPAPTSAQVARACACNGLSGGEPSRRHFAAMASRRGVAAIVTSWRAMRPGAATLTKRSWWKRPGTGGRGEVRAASRGAARPTDGGRPRCARRRRYACLPIGVAAMARPAPVRRRLRFSFTEKCLTPAVPPSTIAKSIDGPTEPGKARRLTATPEPPKTARNPRRA